MKTRTRTRRTVSLALAALAIAIAGTATWALIPNHTQLPGGGAAQAGEPDPPMLVGNSPCHVSGRNLVISVPCDELNRWLEGEGG